MGQNMKIAILASGGNSPGMNNAVITLVKKAKLEKIETLLINDGYDGLLNEDFIKPNLRILEQFNSRGNIIIGSARSKLFYDVANKKKAVQILKKNKIDVLIVIGGDGSYKGASVLAELGAKVMCLPGTIDNDVSSTDTTIGFYTCLNTIVRAIDGIRDSIDSHKGTCFVEVMGRGFSDLAIQAGIATDAEAIITSDNVMNTEDLIKIANETYKRGKRSCLFIVTEQLYGLNGLPSLNDLAKQIEIATSRSCRVNVIGHMQRGGVTDAADRFLAASMANHCIDCIKAKKYNRVISEIRRKIIDVGIKEATTMPKKKNQIQLAKIYERINQV
jgi:6-phosphofructokinase 1